MTHDSTRQAGAQIEITPAMIEAGVKYLRESDALDYPCFATRGLVRELLEASLRARCK